jgi:hypothetical protein
VLSRNAGLNRFAWNFRYPAPKVLPFGYFGGLLPYIEYTLADHAIPGRTPREQPEGPLALPGRYTIELSAAGAHATEALVVEPDPRVRASLSDLTAQLDLAKRLTNGLATSFDGYNALADIRTVLREDLKASGTSEPLSTVQEFEKRLEAVQTGTADAPGLGPANREMARLFSMVEGADVRPTEPLQAAAATWCASLQRALDRWRELNGTELAAANAALRQLHRPEIKVPDAPSAPACSR